MPDNFSGDIDKRGGLSGLFSHYSDNHYLGSFYNMGKCYKT